MVKISAYRRLLNYTKGNIIVQKHALIQKKMESQVKKLSKIKIQKSRVRTTSVFKLLIFTSRRKAKHYFGRWKTITMMRTIVFENYAQIFSDSDTENNLKSKEYKRVKEAVLRLSNQYAESMTFSLSHNLDSNPSDIKKRLNKNLCLMLDDLLREII